MAAKPSHRQGKIPIFSSHREEARARAHRGGTEDWRRPRRAPHRRQRPRGLAIAPAPALRLATMPAVRIAVVAR
jgi:hypothetical protein